MEKRAWELSREDQLLKTCRMVIPNGNSVSDSFLTTSTVKVVKTEGIVTGNIII
jgi:hypothetical protein